MSPSFGWDTKSIVFLPVLFQTNQVAKVVILVHSKNKDAKLPHAKPRSKEGDYKAYLVMRYHENFNLVIKNFLIYPILRFKESKPNNHKNIKIGIYYVNLFLCPVIGAFISKKNPYELFYRRRLMAKVA